MSHTFKAPAGTAFIHNPDLSGAVDIVTPDGRLAVPGEDVRAFILEMVRGITVRPMPNGGILIEYPEVLRGRDTIKVTMS